VLVAAKGIADGKVRFWINVSHAIAMEVSAAASLGNAICNRDPRSD
jgi:hypothetical protein